MNGHGCPLRNRHIPRVPFLCAVMLFFYAPNSAMAAEVSLYLRATWVSGSPESLNGRISIDHGVFEKLQNLSLDAGSTGAFDISADRNTITIDPRVPTKHCGVEFLVRGDLSSVIRYEDLAETQTNASKSIVVGTLSEVASGKQIELRGGRIRLSVTRSPGDRIRVNLDRKNRIFHPGEEISFAVEPVLTGFPANEDLLLSMDLVPARVNKPIVSRQWQVQTDEEGTIQPISVEPFALPLAEAAYDLRFRLSSGKRLLSLEIPWSSGESGISRTVQLAVVNKQAPARDTSPFVEVARIDPGKRDWWKPMWVDSILPEQLVPDQLLPNQLIPEQLIPTKLVPSAKPRLQPLSSDPLAKVEWNGMKLTKLAPRGWQTYPLEIKEPGKPHMLVVRYPSDKSMRMGISLLEPNAAGKVMPLGIDSGVSVYPQVIPSPPEVLEHRVIFWPKTRNPMVALTNYDSNSPAWYLNLSLEAGPSTLPDVSRDSGNLLQSKKPRLVALYLDKPLLSDAFGCTRAYDPVNGIAIEDWRTFLEAGQRLVQYVKWSGYNGAIITVSSEGGTLFPSKTIDSTARFDRGIFASSGCDPSKKDVLELLYRLFDREGLQLVPAIQLSTPLPSLESKLRSSVEDVGIEPINATGHRYVDVVSSEHGLAPYYNPLDDRVTDAIAAGVSELFERYGEHKSFAGVGAHIGGQTYMQMPGAGWGFDSNTLRAFKAETPAAQEVPGQIIPWIEGEGRGQFLAWRGRRLAELYKKMSSALHGHPLILLTSDWLANSNGGATEPERYALEAGLDWESIGGTGNVVPLRLHRSEPLADHPKRASDALLNKRGLWDSRLAAMPSSGALIMRPPTDLRLKALEKESPWGHENTQAWLFAHGVPAGMDSRRSLAKALAMSDHDAFAVGGWTIPRGTESVTREFLSSLAQLPTGRFEDVESNNDESSRIFVLRQQQTEDGLYCYAMNPAPWVTQVKIELYNPAQAEVRELGTDGEIDQATRVIAKTLMPGQLSVFHIASSQAKIGSWSTSVPGKPALTEHLGIQLQKLSQKIGTLTHPTPYLGLTNKNFDLPTDDLHKIPGWLVAQHPADAVTIAEGAGTSGSQAVQLVNNGQTASKTWLLSHPFAPSNSGRLAVDVRVRRDEKTEDVRLRLAIEGRYHDQSIERSVMIGPDTGSLPATDWTTVPYRLEVTDLPIEGLKELRVAFDLASPGKVWIDEVRLYDQFLTNAERKDLQSQVFLAAQSMQSGDLSACGRLLDSYWGRYLMGLPTNESPTIAPPHTAEPRVEQSPSIADRLRQWLPSPIWR